MLILFVASLGLTVGLLVYLVAQTAVPARSRAVARRLDEIKALGPDTWAAAERRRRQARREWVDSALQVLGKGLEQRYGQDGIANKMLIHAGFRGPNAVATYWGARFAAAIGLLAGSFIVLPLMGVSAGMTLGGALYFGALGWVAPVFYVRRRVNQRQKELTLALPDALDLLVVCVEAGLGLNQALLRVAEEIRHVSRLMSVELAVVNLEIRAGTPRENALRNLAERTGVDDLRSLVTMLIQTDRFGTSVAQSLRVHSDTLRQKRRQRAEEAAAKTTIKMIFPLVFCIFPALFVVLLGPGIIMIYRALGGM